MISRSKWRSRSRSSRERRVAAIRTRGKKKKKKKKERKKTRFLEKHPTSCFLSYCVKMFQEFVISIVIREINI